MWRTMPSAVSDNKRIQNRAGGESRRKSAARKSLNLTVLKGSPLRGRIIPCSAPPQTSNKIIQKGLAFAREQSGSVTAPARSVPRDPAPPAAWPRWGCGGGGKRRRTNATEDPDVKTY